MENLEDINPLGRQNNGKKNVGRSMEEYDVTKKWRWKMCEGET